MNFIIEFTHLDEDSLTNEAEWWTIQTNGLSAQKRGGVGVVITAPNGEVLKYEVQLKFPAINNEAEYEGILTRLRLGKAIGSKNLLNQSDSKLVIRQIKEEYEANEERMQKYLRLTKHLTQEFDKVEFVQIPKNQNMVTDKIMKLSLSEEGAASMGLMMGVQKRPSIEEISIHNSEHR